MSIDYDDDLGEVEREVPEGFEVFASIEDYANVEELEDLSYYDLEFEGIDEDADEAREFIASLGLNNAEEDYD